MRCTPCPLRQDPARRTVRYRGADLHVVTHTVASCLRGCTGLARDPLTRLPRTIYSPRCDYAGSHSTFHSCFVHSTEPGHVSLASIRPIPACGDMHPFVRCSQEALPPTRCGTPGTVCLDAPSRVALVTVRPGITATSTSIALLRHVKCARAVHWASIVPCQDRVHSQRRAYRRLVYTP